VTLSLKTMPPKSVGRSDAIPEGLLGLGTVSRSSRLRAKKTRKVDDDLANTKISDVEFGVRQSRHATCHGSQRDDAVGQRRLVNCAETFFSTTKKSVVLVVDVLAL